MPLKIGKSLDYIIDARYGPPVTLCREVEDIGRLQLQEQVGLTQANLSFFASPDVIVIYARKPVLKLQSQALAHNADAIYGVDQRLGSGLEDISFYDLYLTAHGRYVLLASMGPRLFSRGNQIAAE